MCTLKKKTIVIALSEDGSVEGHCPDRLDLGTFQPNLHLFQRGNKPVLVIARLLVVETLAGTGMASYARVPYDAGSYTCMGTSDVLVPVLVPAFALGDTDNKAFVVAVEV